jgi:hypothetical protein
MSRAFIHTFLATFFTWAVSTGLSVEAQATGTKWGPNVPSRLQCDESLLAFYDSLREDLGVEQMLLTVLDSVKEEGSFGKGTFNSIRSIARHRDFRKPQYSLVRRSVEFFLDAKNHREDLLIGTASGRLEKRLCSAQYYPCNERRFAMGIVGQEEGIQELEQRTLKGSEVATPENAPLDFILFPPHVDHQNRSDLVFNWQGTYYIFDEAGFDASLILHELTHYLDEKRVTSWVNANLALLKSGKSADELFVNGHTVSFSEDLSLVRDASNVTVDMGLLLIYYEGRGYQVGMQTQLLSLPPEVEKQANIPQRRTPVTPPARRNILIDQLLRDISAPKNLPRRADANVVREFQQRMAWKGIKGDMTRRWLQNGVPGWVGPVTEKNLFEVSEALAAIMESTIQSAALWQKGVIKDTTK